MCSWPDGPGLIELDSVDSTNREGHRRAAALDIPTWILARMQVSGRGRQGTEWQSIAGNLHATLVLPLGNASEVSPLRSFVAALALRDALVAVNGNNADYRLKWPNDVLQDGGKVAGILLESAIEGCSGRLLIGFGVNLAAAPELPGRPEGSPPPVSVAAAGRAICPKSFLGRLAGAWRRRECQFLAEGFLPIRSEWLSHAHGIGREASFRMTRSVLRGTFRTIDPDGLAVVEAGGVRHRVAAAEMMIG